MKHLAMICDEFSKYAISADWWKKLTPDQQKAYILQHRQTKLRQTPKAPNQNTMANVYKNIPKAWRNVLAYSGIGENSETIQLRDRLNPRLLKSTFDSSSDIPAIIGFDSSMKPVFFLKRSYRDDKFECEFFEKDPQGKYVKDQSGKIVAKRITEQETKYSRRRGSYIDQKSDLRMSVIVDKLPDQPYIVYALKLDPKKQELRQERATLNSKDRHRKVEKKMIGTIAKPIYDYYAEEAQLALKELQDYSIPSFNDVLTKDEQDYTKTKQALSNLENARNKLYGLNSAIQHFKYYGMTPNEPYEKHNVQSFMSQLNEFKERFKEDYKLAIRDKRWNILGSIARGEYTNAADALKDISTDKQIINDVMELPKKIGTPEYDQFRSKVLVAIEKIGEDH